MRNITLRVAILAALTAAAAAVTSNRHRLDAVQYVLYVETEPIAGGPVVHTSYSPFVDEESCRDAGRQVVDAFAANGAGQRLDEWRCYSESDFEKFVSAGGNPSDQNDVD